MPEKCIRFVNPQRGIDWTIRTTTKDEIFGPLQDWFTKNEQVLRRDFKGKYLLMTYEGDQIRNFAAESFDKATDLLPKPVPAEGTHVLVIKL